ncbi:hypothetical protein GCM10007972_15950 [Iodidimonas muriae]|uniref:Rubrerythrin diiron-binding domain-containing protein n=1 Tax=Iodidimonas muriae TaxID=261467 RepID=A0ABQ2LD58_9PROT|nr:ferritin family protein [Iodidimonas muriae]GER07940.1 hypothetical protein JCM17843_22500 [Kordiimonadales bacterium JCM 17843]GGO11820.1 hypothetical protein GCM10007972_15950 [Iodidimonas muriae]
MSLLSQDPQMTPGTMAELIAIATRIEHESVRRYQWLATEMRQRHEHETAAAFDKLALEEQHHVAAVAEWAQAFGDVPSGDHEIHWHLPKELAKNWEGAAGSALLTPYRAFAIAVENEERAFAFYTYLAASTPDAEIAKQAEMLAKEELHHAALLRTWRRAAWHQNERGAHKDSGSSSKIETLPELEAAIAQHEAEIAACGVDFEEDVRTGDDPAPLLKTQGALEKFCTLLETVLITTPDETAREKAEQALHSAIARLATLHHRIDRVKEDQ